MGLLAVFVGLGIAGSAYLQAKRAGLWSWRRFFVSVAFLVSLGIVVGLVTVRVGRMAGPERAGPLAAAAAVVIFLGVVLLALWQRGPRRPRR
jgi:hypothetical protein